MKQLNVEIPADLHRSAKMHAISADLTLQQWVIKTLQEACSRPIEAPKVSSTVHAFPVDAVAAAAAKAAVASLSPTPEAGESSGRISGPRAIGQKRQGARPKPQAPAPK